MRLVLATRNPAPTGSRSSSACSTTAPAHGRASVSSGRRGRWPSCVDAIGATPQDVYDVAYDILNARLALSYRALAEGFTIDDVLVELLSTVPAPWGVVASPPVQPAWVGQPDQMAQPGPVAQPVWNGQPGWVAQPSGAPSAYPQQQAWTVQPGAVPAEYPQQPAYPAPVAQPQVPQQPVSQQPAYPAQVPQQPMPQPMPQPVAQQPVAQQPVAQPPVVGPTQVVAPAQIVTAGAPQGWPAADVPVKVMPGDPGPGPR